MTNHKLTDERAAIDRRMRDHYESVWQREDPWGFERSEFDRQRYQKQVALITDRGYRHALEIGCGSGHFTRMLCARCEHVVAVDISASAIERARHMLRDVNNVDLQVANIMDWVPRSQTEW